MKYLEDYVNGRLLDFIVILNYPMQEAVGTGSFFAALHKWGADVGSARPATRGFNIGEQAPLVRSMHRDIAVGNAVFSCGYDFFVSEVPRGWTIASYASYKSYVDSYQRALLMIGCQLPSSVSEAWQQTRERELLALETAFKTEVLSWTGQYQENILMSVNMGVSPLRPPVILKQVIADIPEQTLHDSACAESRGDPHRQDILKHQVWADYVCRVARQKGYGTFKPNVAVQKGLRMFPRAEKLWPPVQTE